jgi:hypothetical protein
MVGGATRAVAVDVIGRGSVETRSAVQAASVAAANATPTAAAPTRDVLSRLPEPRELQAMHSSNREDVSKDGTSPTRMHCGHA